MSSELRVAVFGIGGRMGRAVVAALAELPHGVLVGASASPNSEWVGRSLGDFGDADPTARVSPDAAGALQGANVAIDFTLPEATPANLAACIAAGCPLVIGTTGYGESVRTEISAAASKIPILVAPNMSLGVNLLLRLVESAAATLHDEYDIEIFEAHHRNKKDAPSGTALALGAAAAAGRGVSLQEVAEYDRRDAGAVRRRGAIGFSVFRGGDVIGDHTVTFAGWGERIELTHRASDRLAFARGAVQAAQWLSGQSPGSYSMFDVLGFESS